mgnify:CR=1
MLIPSQAHLWEGVETRRAASLGDEGIVQTTNIYYMVMKIIVV